MSFTLDPATAISDPHGISWGMHPITWRNDDIPEVGAFNTLEDMLLDLADTGYAGTECAGFFPPKEEVKAAAEARGIKIVAQWFSSFILRDGVEAVIPDFEATCAYLEYLGATRVVVSEQTGSVQGIRDVCIFTNKPVLTEEQWPVLAEGLNRLGDVAHAHVGDGDVMGLLEATIDRVKHVHFKDVRPEKMEESKAAERSFLDSFLAGMFTVPGDGTIDFTVPYKFLVDHGYSEWILVEAEQDPAIANPLEYARKARAYLEGTLFKA